MRALLSALLVLAIAAPAWAQTTPVVTRVTLAGDVVDRAALAPLVQVQVGAPLDPVAVRRTLELLYTKGPFAGIEVDETPSAGGVALTFRLQRQLLVGAWQFTGNAHLDADTLARTLSLVWGQAANPEAFAHDAQLIHDRYQREGFLHASATLRVVPQGHGMAKLAIAVNEGQPLTIDSVPVPVSGPFKPAEVVRLFGLGRGDRLVRDKVFQGLTNLDQALMRSAYLNGRVTHLFVLPNGTRTASYQDVIAAAPDHVGLVIAIEPGQKGIVAVKADKLLATSDLSQAVSVYRDRSYSPAELDDSAAGLVALYVSHGYPDATVTHTLTRQPDGSYLIVFDVHAGQHVVIQAIRFEGNHAFSNKALLGTFRTQPKGLFGGGVFEPKIWQEDLDTLPQTYRSAGYLSARVTGVDRLLSAKGAQLTLVVHLHEGPQSRVARILFKGATPLQEASLLEALPLNPGDPYDPDNLPDYISSVEATYARTGYPLARVTAQYEPGPTPALGALRFTIDQSTLKRLGEVVLTGNVKTHDDVIRRQFTVHTGERYNAAAILQTQEQVYQLGFFDRVDVTPLKPIDPDPDDPVDLLVSVHERPTGSVQVGAGYGDDILVSGPTANLGYQDINLWGTGRPLRLEGDFSFQRSTGLVSLRDPYLLGHHLIGEAGLSYVHDTIQTGVATGLEYQTYGPSVAVSKQLTPALLGTLRYAWSHTNYLHATPDQLAAEGGAANRTDSIVTPSFTYDTRSDLLDPRWGSRADVGVDLALPVLGGSLLYTRPHADLARYIPLPHRLVLAVGANLGYIQPLWHTTSVPDDVLFQVGLNNILRGYPITGTGQLGQALAIGHVELRFPIRGAFGAVVFVDAGNAWPDWRSIGWRSTLVTAGLGARYETPVGPLRLDYGFHVLPQIGMSGWQGFSFGIGQAF